MRGLLFIILAVAVLALVGWISFGHDDDRASINLETQEIRDDTRKVLDSGTKALERVGEKIESATQDADKE
jgi:hypothetical protein